MNLNLFDNKKINHEFINKFIEDLKEALIIKMNNEQDKNEKDNELDEYILYEKKKVFLDNQSRESKDLVWVMDNDSACISKDGDGGPIFISNIDLPQNKKVGDVFEKINSKYVYNEKLTKEINKIV